MSFKVDYEAITVNNIEFQYFLNLFSTYFPFFSTGMKRYTDDETDFSSDTRSVGDEWAVEGGIVGLEKGPVKQSF